MVDRISDPSKSAAGGGLASPLLASMRARAVAKYVVGARILDGGCGHSHLLRFLRSEQMYIGIDRDARLLRSLRQRHPSRLFYCLDLDESELGELSEFDTIVLAAVVEHLERPIDVVRRLGAKLRVGGRLILTTPHPISAPFLSLGAQLKLLSPGARDEHKRLVGRRELFELLRTAGLSPVSYGRFLVGLNQIVVAQR